MSERHGASNAQTRDHILTFLGGDAALGGPFALLGIAYSPISDSLILEACKDRLDQVARHPRSYTTAADEVRLAIHSAGSQLLDSALRAELMKHWPEGIGIHSKVPHGPSAWESGASEQLSSAVRDQAQSILASCGGWNERSRNRLGHLARSNQITATQLVSGILEDQSTPVLQALGAPNQQNARKLVPALHTNHSSVPWVVIPLVYVAMVAALGYAGFDTYQQRLVLAAGSVVEESINDSDALESSRSVPGSQSNESASRRHYSSIIHELDRMARKRVLNPADAIELSQVGRRMGAQWEEFSYDELVEASESIDTALRDIINADDYQLAIEFLVENRGSPAEPIVFDMLRTLLFEVDIDESSTKLVEESEDYSLELSKALTGSLGSRSLKSGDDPNWWRWWIDQVNAESVSELKGEAQTKLIQDSAYHRLVEPMGESQWDLCTQQIVKNLRWGAGGEARLWFMGLIRDTSVQSDRLSQLTRSIARFSSADGMGVGMILEPKSTMEQREVYFESLRDAWAPAAGSGDDFRLILINRLDVMLRTTRNQQPDERSMIRSLELARLNSSCFARYRKDEAALYQLDAELDTPFDGLERRSIELNLSSSASDSQWASGARNAETPDEINRLFNELARFDELGPKSAHSLVYLVMQAPSLESRAMAQQAILARRDSGALMIAFDRVLQNRASSRMLEVASAFLGLEEDNLSIEHLQGVLQRRIVETGFVHSGTDQSLNLDAVMDHWEAVLAHRMGPISGSTVSIQEFYESMLSQYIRERKGIPQEVVNNLRMRLFLSTGPVHRFHAYQNASMELFAIYVRGEFPALALQVSEVMSDYAAELAVSQTIYQQVLVGEQTMGMIWKLILDNEVHY